MKREQGMKGKEKKKEKEKGKEHWLLNLRQTTLKYKIPKMKIENGRNERKKMERERNRDDINENNKKG